MVTPFGKILRKLRIDHSERLLDMSKKLGVSIAFLSSVEIGKKSVPVGMEEKIIELYDLDRDMASLLRKEANMCRKSFTINPSTQLQQETVVAFMRLLDGLHQEALADFKQTLETLCEAYLVEEC
ncbi:helix-turn-helix domain-containing protein [Bartonella senegalensis]|uniref:helix-turn-helix domain-containing protein n=1 Tax=Bartonella senegalensis TaxID=1468418 RepID=UPI0002EAA94E|nr:helix-turn-helix transcriptional regulator [Bartonella senegalensis]